MASVCQYTLYIVTKSRRVGSTVRYTRVCVSDNCTHGVGSGWVQGDHRVTVGVRTDLPHKVGTQSGHLALSRVRTACMHAHELEKEGHCAIRTSRAAPP